MDRITEVVDTLSSYYSKDEPFPHCVYLYGQKSLGQEILNKFLESNLNISKLNCWISSVVINANECYVSKILFESIINGFNNHQPSKDNNYTPFARLDSVEDFLIELSALNTSEAYLIVIENAEKLREMEFNIIPVFMKLQEFTGLNISCLLTSHIALEKFSMSPMIKIHMTDLTKAELIDVFANNYEDIKIGMRKQISDDETIDDRETVRQIKEANKLNVEFFKNYLNIFLNVFYKTCRDYHELQPLAVKFYSMYYAPVISGEIKSNDITNLWRNITKHLKAHGVNSCYMRVENFSDKDLVHNEDLIIDLTKDTQNSVRTFAQTLELPYYAKYLLIASFLASHNDAKSDKRLFMKHHGKERKRHQKAKVSEKMNVQFGPKSFTIDRLLAIFYAILDEKIGLTCNLLSQISTLVDLNFLTFVSGESNIMEGSARLQSTIGLEFAISIGKVVGFNVKQYLTDFH